MKVEELVAEGCRLDREIKEREGRLKEIKVELGERAGGEKVSWESPEGKASVFHGARLVSRVDDEKTVEKCRTLAGKFFDALFVPAPIAKFKDVAKAVLDEKSASKLAELLTGERYTSVKFEPKAG